MPHRARVLAAVLWDALVAVAATAAVAVVPVTILPGFGFRLSAGSGVEWVLTAVFAVDAVVQARRLRLVPFSRRRAARAGVVLSALAAVPTVALGLPHGWVALRLLALHRVAGLMRAYTRRHASRTSVLRLVFFAYWVAVVVHVIACGFVQIGGTPGFATDTDRYVNALYWAMATLTTVGYGDVDTSGTVLRLYAIGVMILGVGAYAFLIGNIASLLSSMDPLRAAHDERRTRIGAFMRYRRLPPSLQARVYRYLDHAWDEGFAVDEDAALAGLPVGLRETVVLHLRRELLRAIPLFADASDVFLREVALQMRSMVYLPDDVVVHAGEHGSELFVVARGRVEVVGPTGHRYRTLTDGDFFGEIALFRNTVRTATVRALAPSDLYVLDRALFERVVATYPEVAAALAEAAALREAADAPDAASR